MQTLGQGVGLVIPQGRAEMEHRRAVAPHRHGVSFFHAVAGQHPGHAHGLLRAGEGDLHVQPGWGGVALAVQGAKKRRAGHGQRQRFRRLDAVVRRHSVGSCAQQQHPRQGQKSSDKQEQQRDIQFFALYTPPRFHIQPPGVISPYTASPDSLFTQVKCTTEVGVPQ